MVTHVGQQRVSRASTTMKVLTRFQFSHTLPTYTKRICTNFVSQPWIRIRTNTVHSPYLTLPYLTLRTLPLLPYLRVRQFLGFPLLNAHPRWADSLIRDQWHDI